MSGVEAEVGKGREVSSAAARLCLKLETMARTSGGRVVAFKGKRACEFHMVELK